MKAYLLPLACTVATTFGVLPAVQAEPNTRTIRLLQDDAQIPVVSKLYDLKYVKATDIRPYILAAVTRYDSLSTVERVNFPTKKKTMLLVSTGAAFMPYVDALIEAIDRPGKYDEYGSIIEGTGITRVSYTPNYRTGDDVVNIINNVLRTGIGRAYWNEPTNTIYWKDDSSSAAAILKWVEYLDRPLPQANVRLSYYEIRESTLRDIGVDYLAWKNGPGLNLLALGYNGGKIVSDEAVVNLVGSTGTLATLAETFSGSWGYGGIFAAPQFDMSFIRLLQQAGVAKVAATADLTFVNTPVYMEQSQNKVYTYSVALAPDYQNILKDSDDRTLIRTGQSSEFVFTVTNPVICFNPDAEDIDQWGCIPCSPEFYHKNKGNILLNYSLVAKDVVERSNRGEELGNAAHVNGSMTLATQHEKVVATYAKETEVEQQIGIPFLVEIPILKYLFGTTTTHMEKTYIVITAEASLVYPDSTLPKRSNSPIVVDAE